MRLPAALALTLVVAYALLLGACEGDDGSAQPDAAGVGVRIGELDVEAEVVDTPEARALGLGKRESLDRDRGMLFVFPREGQYAFWMKDMLFPLDFVWISSELRVVDLLEDVPPPAEGAENSSLPLYRPAEDVLYVLEVNAGLIAETGVRIGNEVAIEGGVPVVTQ